MPTRTRRRILSADLLERERVGGFGRSVPFADDVFPNAFHISPWMSWSGSTDGGAGNTQPVRTNHASYASLGFISNDPDTDNGDAVEWNVRLAAGTWSIRALHVATSNRGIFDLHLDGVEVGSFDMYNAGTVYNTASTVTGITVSSSGIHVVKLIVDGKHASSASYLYGLNGLSGVRTGA